ncbi:MAG: hypothetical protein D4R65_07050 [Verrucomicrobiaceae bacterium]|nr:MAG: hypothetical protein D4R65_07050 [Verrucomicrobiaceae bacterium]
MNSVLAADLRRWFKRGEVEQSYPHRPEHFWDRFPEAATEDLLVNNVWWWRYADPEKYLRIFPEWGDGLEWWSQKLFLTFQNHLEASAYFYEFRARYNDRYVWDFDRPWIRCSDQQWRSLNRLLPSKYPSTVDLPITRPIDNWVSLPPLNLNLGLNDEILFREFKLELERKRQEIGLERPATGQGVRRRAISWKPIEFMDYRRYKIMVLNDAERSGLSKARRSYERTCTRLGLEP